MKRSALLISMLVVGVTHACTKAEPSSDEIDGIGGESDFQVSTGGSVGADGSGGATGGAPDEPGAPLTACTLNGEATVAKKDGSLVYDDFDDGDALVTGNGKSGDWYEYGDETSTQSPSWEDADGWLPEQGGLTQDGYALHAVGSGFSSWGSGQGTVPAWDMDAERICLFDASAYDGLSFWVRGEITYESGSAAEQDRNVLRFGVTEPDVIPVTEGGNCTGNAGQCWDWHKVRIPLDDCWRRHSIRFDELEQDGWGESAGELELDKVTNFNFEIAQGHSYDFWLDEVEFFIGDTPEEEELCGSFGAGGAGGAGGASN